MSRCRRLLTAVALAALAGAATGAPVDAGSGAADPYELAVRWTVASLAPADAPPPPPAPAPVVRLSAVPHGAAAGGAPEPGAYALMGALLLVVGLIAHRVGNTRGGRRGRPA